MNQPTNDTPSVSHSLDSSLREGAGDGGAVPFNVPPKNSNETQKTLHFTIHRTTLPQSRIRSTAPSGREPGMGLYHSTGCSLKSGGAGGTLNGIRPDDGVPGSLSEGAGSPQGLTEGVYCDERNKSKISEPIKNCV